MILDEKRRVRNSSERKIKEAPFNILITELSLMSSLISPLDRINQKPLILGTLVKD
jgi:hypothetical protein